MGCQVLQVKLENVGRKVNEVKEVQVVKMAQPGSLVPLERQDHLVELELECRAHLVLLVGQAQPVQKVQQVCLGLCEQKGLTKKV